MQAGVNVATARVLAAFHRLRHVECFGRYSRSKAATQVVSGRPWRGGLEISCDRAVSA